MKREISNFFENPSQNFVKIALCGVVGNERKIRGVGKLPNKQKSPAVGRQKTDDFTERVPFPFSGQAGEAACFAQGGDGAENL